MTKAVGELALELGDLHAQRSARRPLALLRRGESLEGLARSCRAAGPPWQETIPPFRARTQTQLRRKPSTATPRGGWPARPRHPPRIAGSAGYHGRERARAGARRTASRARDAESATTSSPSAVVRMPRLSWSTSEASSAHTGTPVSTSAINSASANRSRDRKPPWSSRRPPPPRSGSATHPDRARPGERTSGTRAGSAWSASPRRRHRDNGPTARSAVAPPHAELARTRASSTDPVQPKARKLLANCGLDQADRNAQPETPAPAQQRLHPSREGRSRSASARRSAGRPPSRHDRQLDHRTRGDAVNGAHAAVGVVGDRDRPAVRAHQPWRSPRGRR